MVKREKFLEDARADPARIYRSPNDILRDRRLTDDQRREILTAWEQKLHDEAKDQDSELVAAVHRAVQELDEDGYSGRVARRNENR